MVLLISAHCVCVCVRGWGQLGGGQGRIEEMEQVGEVVSAVLLGDQQEVDGWI